MAINAGTILAYLDLDTSKFGSAIQLAEQQVSDFAGSGSGLSGVLDGVGAGMTTVGNALTVGVSAPLVGLGVAAVSTGMEFDAQMSRVQAISMASAEEMQTLREAAIQMGADSVFGATDAAKALEYMGAAGWKTDQMIAGLPGVIDLAAASGEDLGSVADIVTNSLTAFGLSASDSAHFADVLAAASAASNTNVGLMGETFKYVAPLAGALGYTIEDMSLGIGLMANAGIKGSQAGTALRGMLTNLSKPTEDIAAAMDKYNISLTDASGNMLPYRDLLLNLRGAFSGLSEVQKSELAATLAGQEGMSGLLAIVNASETDFNNLAGAIDNSAGATETMAGLMLDNLKGDMEGLSGALESVSLKFSDWITPAVRTVVQGLSRAVDWFGNLDSGLQTIIFRAGAFAAGLGPVLTVGGKLLSAFSPVIPVLAALGGAFALVYSRSERLQAITAKLKTDGLAAFDNLKNGLQNYQAQVAAGTTWTDALAKSINIAFGDDTGAKVNNISSRVIGGFQTAGDIVSGTYNGVGEFIASLIDGQGAAVSLEEGLQAAFGGNVPDRVRELQASMAQFVSDIRDDFAEGGILGVMQGLGSRIGDALSDGWDAAKAGAATVREHIADGLSMAKDWLAPKAEVWMTNLGESLQDAKQYAIDQLPAVREALADGLSLAKDKLESGAKSAMKWLGDAYRSGSVQRGLGTLTKVGSTILDKISASKTTIIDKAGELLKGLGTALGSDEAKEKLGDLADIAAAIATKIASGVGGWKVTAGKLISDLVVQMTDNGFLSSALEGVGKIVTGIADGLGAAAGNIATAAEAIINALVDSITKGDLLTNIFTSAGELITKIAGIIGSAAPGIISAATMIGIALINGLVGLDWGTIFTTAGTVITSIGSVLGNVAINVAGAATDIGIALVNGISGLDWPTIFDAAGDVITAIAGVLGGVASNMATAAKDIGIALLDGLTKLDWPTIFTTAGDVVTAIGKILAENSTQIATAALDLGKALLTGLASVDWAGISQSLATACGNLVQAIVEWFKKPENVQALGDAAAAIATGIATGVINAIDPSLINLDPLQLGLSYQITMYRDQQNGAAEWAQGVYDDLITRVNAGSTTASQQMAGAVSLILDGFYGQLNANQPELAMQAAQFNTAFINSFDVQGVKDTFSQMGFDISDELATALNNGSVQLADVLRGLSLGMNEDMILSMGQNFNMDSWLMSYFGNTSTEVSNLLKNSATDWGKVFGQAIPEGATAGLENGMYVLRSKTGDVIKLVSAVDAQAEVATGNKDTAQAGIDAASKALDDGKTTVGTSAQGVVDATTTPFDALPEATKVQAAVMMEGINSAITAGTPAATAAVQTAANAVSDKAAEILNTGTGTTVGSSFIGGIATSILAKMSALQTNARTVAQSGLSAISSILSAGTGYGLGSNMVQGIINGVGSTGGALAAKMRSLANSAVAAFRGALDMHSPSVVLIGDGALIPLSIGMGVDRNKEAAIRSMVSLAGDMQDAWPGIDVNPPKVTGNPNNPGGWDDDESGNVFNFYGNITVREDADIQKVSAALAEEFRDQLRGNGG